MNTAFKKHPFFKARQQWPTPQKASKSPDALSLGQPCVEASRDEVSCGKIVRRPLMAIGLLAGWLTMALMAGGCSKPAVKDSRLQSPRVEVFKTEAAGSNSRTFTGIVEARVQSDLGFRVGGKILERSVDVGQRVQKGQPLMRLDPEDLRLSAAAQQANVEAARAKYTQAKADEARPAMLIKSGVISGREYDEDAADPASRTFEARYVLEGEAASAPLGSTITISVVTKQTSGNQSVRVPVGAVYDRGSGPGVWIVDDKSEVKFRPVQVASIGQEEVVVSHGVQAGEKVVALGAHLLHEGQVVNAAKEESYAKF